MCVVQGVGIRVTASIAMLIAAVLVLLLAGGEEVGGEEAAEVAPLQDSLHGP